MGATLLAMLPLRPSTPNPDAPRLWSLGHSVLAFETFRELLAAHGIERVVDVRRYPVSRRQPHFSRDALALALPRASVHYVHLVELGGQREESPSSLHTALPPGAFRGYADHMATPAFATALAHLLGLALERRTAVMCAEARWSDCHRKLLCDRLVAEGAAVLHVRHDGPAEPHRLTPEARLERGSRLGEGVVLLYRGVVQPGLFD